MMVTVVQVLSVPENGIEHYGRGPLLSAKEPDRDVCWQRCRQAMEICHQVRCHGHGGLRPALHVTEL